MAVVQGTEAVYRRQIVHLVKAIAEIPQEVRAKWRNEIAQKQRTEPDLGSLTPDDVLVFLV